MFFFMLINLKLLLIGNINYIFLDIKEMNIKSVKIFFFLNYFNKNIFDNSNIKQL